MLTIFAIFLFFYTALTGGMYLFQRRLMYHPDTAIGAPEDYGLHGFEDVRIATPDHRILQLWHCPASAGFPTVAYFHGNAGHVGNRAPIFAALAAKGFGVATVNYRGYGKSEGTPDEAGIYDDARDALRFLTEQQGIPASHILLYGESLGTGVAVQMATETRIAGIILQAPYTSVVTRAAEMYPYLPVRLMLHDRFDSLAKIKNVAAPLLLFHGEQDAVIPVSHGKALLAVAHEPKQAVFFPHGGHNNFDSDVISAHVLNFAQKANLIKP